MAQQQSSQCTTAVPKKPCTKAVRSADTDEGGSNTSAIHECLRSAEKLEFLSLEMLGSAKDLAYEQAEEKIVRGHQDCEEQWVFNDLVLPELKGISFVGGAVCLEELVRFVQGQPQIQKLRLVSTRVYFSESNKEGFKTLREEFAKLLAELEVSFAGDTRAVFPDSDG
ncbi:hypothetical protein CERZMDRAFT_85648 [Cercospora zeae-maydis SCOH1-5]|uniref:Uncharacterized protein n=1 Tax=Cercospora zeae-maydis SCOH1-5 TaxID=717836 RepID=A0A6A6FC81_9PEZI|nr:hypothetical protein CERZMDRAFT_85648 [Cercospora zeae-maydis SCOH1-5]